jgi:hypothetical protein
LRTHSLATGQRRAYEGAVSRLPTSAWRAARQTRSTRHGKSIDLDVARATLWRFAEAGIWNHVFLVSGLPRETEADHQATLAFLDQNRGAIHSIQASAFRMEIDSDVTLLGERYGFRAAPRAATSLELEVQLEARGTIPDVDAARQRVQEIRTLAYRGQDTLALSRNIWDAHKVMFAVTHGRAALGREAPPPAAEWTQP